MRCSFLFGLLLSFCTLSMMKTIRLHIAGKVQDVFFRAEAKKVADRLGLTGWVKNDEDGGVTCVVHGDQDQLGQFLKWCKNGPGAARVDHVESSPFNFDEVFASFEIRRSSYRGLL